MPEKSTQAKMPNFCIDSNASQKTYLSEAFGTLQKDQNDILVLPKKLNLAWILENFSSEIGPKKSQK